MKDDDGFIVKAGDTIRFCLGCNSYVSAKVERINGHLYAMTPDHNPKQCRLSKLREYVGAFYRES